MQFYTAMHVLMLLVSLSTMSRVDVLPEVNAFNLTSDRSDSKTPNRVVKRTRCQTAGQCLQSVDCGDVVRRSAPTTTTTTTLLLKRLASDAFAACGNAGIDLFHAR